ncbi:MAG TPA: hypothetical protein VGL86_27640 [Polyangia bacterium]|jgi:hypothetical protein
MQKAPWKVLPHGPIEAVSDRLRTVEGALPGMPLKRTMAVVRLDDGGLVVHSAIALDPSTQKELEAWGTPRILIVPNAWHRLDAPAYKTRYPEIKIYCPEGAKKRVAKLVPIDGGYDALPPMPPLAVRYLDGVKKREGYLELADDAGTTLIFNDAVFNQPHLPGFFGVVYRTIGSSGGPRVTPLIKLAMVKDERALRAQLEKLADTPRLRRVVMAHGTRVDDDAAAYLRQVAATL